MLAKFAPTALVNAADLNMNDPLSYACFVLDNSKMRGIFAVLVDDGKEMSKSQEHDAFYRTLKQS